MTTHRLSPGSHRAPVLSVASGPTPWFLCLTVLLNALVALGSEQEWPGFRGPDGNGVSLHGKPPIHFGPRENVAWTVPVPRGHGSPCVWGDRVFITGVDEGRLVCLGLDRATGRMLWRQTVETTTLERHHETGGPATATPCADEGNVVVYFGSLGLICFDHDGAIRWRLALPVPEMLDAFGSGTSAVLCDGLVVLVRDQEAGSEALAVRVADGTVAWRIPRPEFRSAWSSPAVWRRESETNVVFAGSTRLTGHDLNTGRQIWFASGIPAYPATTPVTDGERLVFAGWIPAAANPTVPSFDASLAQGGDVKSGAVRLGSGNPAIDAWGRGHDTNRDGWIDRHEWEGVLGFWSARADETLLLRAGGSGDVTRTRVAWRTKRGAPHIASPLLYRDRVYLIQEGGLATCLDATTGRVIYEQERLGGPGQYFASPIAADGRLYLASAAGVITVVKAGDTFEKLAQSDLAEPVMATPALVGTMICIRSEKHLWAFRSPN